MSTKNIKELRKTSKIHREALDEVYPEMKDKAALLFDIGLYMDYPVFEDNVIVCVYLGEKLSDIPVFENGLFLNKPRSGRHSAYYDMNAAVSSKYHTNHSLATINKRYPNKTFLTLSGRNGKKVCKDGFPVFGSIDDFNRKKWMNIFVGNKAIPDEITKIMDVSIKEARRMYNEDSSVYLGHNFIMPLNIQLDEGCNVNRIKIKFSDPTIHDMSESGFTITTNPMRFPCRPLNYNANGGFLDGFVWDKESDGRKDEQESHFYDHTDMVTDLSESYGNVSIVKVFDGSPGIFVGGWENELAMDELEEMYTKEQLDELVANG